MLAADSPTLDVLILIGTAGPIALYFLTLGFINSHARPRLVSSRGDFLALSIAIAPVALWALPFTMQFASAWWTAFAVVLLGIGMHALLPRAGEGFVIYNITHAEFLRHFRQSVARVAPDADQNAAGAWRTPAGDLCITVSAFPLLRNVSVRLDGEASRVQSAAAALRDEVGRRLEHVEQLPSPVGTCLVMTGAAIALVPMWLLTRHVHDLVDVVASLFG